MTRRLHHLVRVPFYLLGLLLLLELLLQLGALISQGADAPGAGAVANRQHSHVLALGDSNTYGLYLEAAGSVAGAIGTTDGMLPIPNRPVEVLNLGYPATNSFRVRENLPALLDKLSPDIVLIMVGFNDFWTPIETVNTQQNKNMLDWVKNHSRLYKLCLIGMRSRIAQQDMTFGYPRGGWVDVNNNEQRLVHVDGEVFRMAAELGEPARHRNAMSDNLKAMIDMVRAHNAGVYLMTYPSNWGFYPGANKWLKKVAEEQAIPLIDITPLFVTLCVDGAASCPDILFHDGHATAQGNALVAAEVNKQLESIKNR
jgi:lysophospholipase L1-like esterase